MRTPPHSIDAEKSLLGSLLMAHSTAYDEIDMAPGDFYKQSHRVVFGAIEELHRRRITPDVVTLHNLLNEQGLVERAGGLRYYATLPDTVPTFINAGHYAGIISRMAAQRALIAECEDTANKAYGDVADFAAFISDHEARVLATTDRAVSLGGGIEHITNDLSDYLASLEALAEDRAEPSFGVKTGFARLDAMLAGLQPGLVTGLAARPSHGKTACALSIALFAAISGVSVLYNTLEMPKRLLRGRFLAMLSGVPLAVCNLRRKPRGKEHGLLVAAALKLKALPIFIDDDAALTMATLRSRAKRHLRQNGLGLIIVDYIQLVTPSPLTKGKGSDTELTEVSRDSVILAKDLDVPILALAQLNRGSERHAGGVPRLSDVRGSGCFEQDWRNAVLIHRPDLRPPEDDAKGKGPQKAHETEPQLIVAKNSEGETGWVPVQFIGNRAMFMDTPDEAEGAWAS